MKKDFLLEINTEELPAGYVSQALEKLWENFHKEMRPSGIVLDSNKRIINLGTKNSLICYIKDISLRQKESSKEVLGPPKRIAFDEKGNPMKQALGFAKNQGVRVEDLKIKKTPKGEYVVIEKKEKSRSMKDILEEITPRIIKNPSFPLFPKTMRWDDSGLRFARPIESVFALFGKEIIDVRIDKIPQKKIKPIEPAKYLKGLGESIDCNIRKNKIRRLILNALRKVRADEIVDENLLNEVTFMVNSPNVVIGEFDKKFLALPEDVLKASMSKHQRVFPVSKNGKLINRFIAIIEGKRKTRLVRKNYEKILEAKLQDSLFFFDEDTKRALTENISQLKALIFQKDLGSMFEKIERLKRLSVFICERSGADSSLKIDTERAAGLSKLDLVTHMVGEFPSLQGAMGREYALKSGEKKEVAVAIGEHYLPQGSDDDLPKTQAGAILAISDKIDNLVGFLGMGAEASGSFDPFGVRRNALGIVRIIRDKALRLKLDELIQKAIELYGDKLKASREQLKNKITDYIKDRIEFLMRGTEPSDLPADIVKGILKSGSFDVVDIFNRYNQLAELHKQEQRVFFQAAKVVERTNNILKGVKGEKIGSVDKKLFREDIEKEIWNIYLNSKNKIQELIDKGQYKQTTRKYAQVFFETLNTFFDKVLVNTEDKTLRLNRLAMMKAINRLYSEQVCDLSLIPYIVVD